MQPLGGGTPHIVQHKTKLQASFRDLETLLSAWMIYTSIRLAYAPERGSGLAVWTERLVNCSRSSFDFTAIVNYFVAYFQKYQNSPPEAWYNIDPELYTEHLANVTQKAMMSLRPTHSPSPIKLPHSGNTRPAGASTNTPKDSRAPITEQICFNWNRPSGCKIRENMGVDCLRQHVCSKCKAPGHRQYECPEKAKQTQA